MREPFDDRQFRQWLNPIDQLEILQPAAGWEEEVLGKLHASRQKRNESARLTKLALIITCFLLVNVFAFYRVSKQNGTPVTQRILLLQQFSEEMLISSSVSK